MSHSIIPSPLRVNPSVRPVPVFSELEDAIDHAADGGTLWVLAEPSSGLAEVSWVGARPGSRPALEDLVRRESMYGTQGFYGDRGIIRDVPLDRVRVVASTICAVAGVRP